MSARIETPAAERQTATLSRRRSPRPLHPLVLEWFGDLQSEGLALNTCRAYAADLGELVEFAGGDLDGATRETLFAYRRSLLVRNLALATRARRVTAVRSFFDWLRKRRGEPLSIAHDLLPPTRAETVHRWWTVEQIARFRQAFTDRTPTGLRDRAICELGLLGLRVGEIVGLNVDDVRDLDHPARAAILVHRKPRGREQIIPLSADARTALSDWVRVRPEQPTSAVFFRLPYQPGRKSDRLVYASAEKLFRHYAAQAGLPLHKGQSIHLLRHSTAQRLADTGVPIQDIQALLGHRSADTTAIYFRVTDARLRSTVQHLTYETPRDEGDGDGAQG